MTTARWAESGEVIIRAFSEYQTADNTGGYVKHKRLLSKTVIYRDWANPDECISTGMRVYGELIAAYASWQDGDVTVSILIKDQAVNM